MLFSERKKLKVKGNLFQVDIVNEELRNRLWNMICIFYLNVKAKSIDELELFAKWLWHNHFKKPIDTIPRYWNYTYNEIREHFFACEWYEVYDFLEYIVKYYPDKAYVKIDDFIGKCNIILEEELSAYRFVDEIIVEITSEEEIAEIEEAIDSSDKFKSVSTHIKTALNLIADKENPDYRNSIKESISAVEAMCRIITADQNATLGEALSKIEKNLNPLHPALKSAFNKLYGYTSDEDGIRHSLMEESELDFEDAKFMLVACSAFINYLKAKMSKSGSSE